MIRALRSRRRFLGIALSLLGSLLAARWLLYRGRSELLVAKLIKNRLSFVEIEPSALASFSRDFIDVVYGGGFRAAILVKWIMNEHSSFLADAEIQSITEYASKTFLLSTDFFLHPPGQERVTQYLGIYEPYTRPCSNPFKANGFL